MKSDKEPKAEPIIGRLFNLFVTLFTVAGVEPEIES